MRSCSLQVVEPLPALVGARCLQASESEPLRFMAECGGQHATLPSSCHSGAHLGVPSAVMLKTYLSWT